MTLRTAHQRADRRSALVDPGEVAGRTVAPLDDVSIETPISRCALQRTSAAVVSDRDRHPKPGQYWGSEVLSTGAVADL